MRSAGRVKRTAPVIAGAALLISACAQAPQLSEDRVDPIYGGLSPAAAMLARSTLQEALETLRSRNSLTWADSDSGGQGEVTPLRTYRSTTGHYCREYLEVVQSSLDGLRSRRRVACRDEDGVWKPVRS